MTNPSTRERLIPLVVVVGYLGAGKTTLVNHLLAANTGFRLAVVVNDINAVNIDADLISAHDGDTYELTKRLHLLSDHRRSRRHTHQERCIARSG